MLISELAPSWPPSPSRINSKHTTKIPIKTKEQNSSSHRKKKKKNLFQPFLDNSHLEATCAGCAAQRPLPDTCVPGLPAPRTSATPTRAEQGPTGHYQDPPKLPPLTPPITWSKMPARRWAGYFLPFFLPSSLLGCFQTHPSLSHMLAKPSCNTQGRNPLAEVAQNAWSSPSPRPMSSAQ